MRYNSQLSTPWAARSNLYSAPGSLIVKLCLGEAPEPIPAAADVRRGARRPVDRMRVGEVDRVLNHFAHGVHITRVHTAAASLRRSGVGHEDYDDIEHVIGLSRTFRIDTDQGAPVEDVVDALRQLVTVEHAYPHYLSVTPFALPARAPTNHQPPPGEFSRTQIHAYEAMAYEPGDPAVIVAVVDTGVAQAHPELDRRLRAGLDTVQIVATNLASGIKLVGDLTGVDTDPEDFVGHGTSCAAIIGAAGLNIPPGLAGECGLMPIRVLGAAQFPGKQTLVGIGALANIDQGVKSAIDLGAKVINMSFGTPLEALAEHDPIPHQDVVRYGLTRGCVLIAASGNSGKEEPFSPAALDGVIAVGAVDADDQPTSFSTSGPHVALSAPGERVLSAGLDGYQMVTGTSFAAPFVAAVAGLLVSRATRRVYPLDGVSVRRILTQSVRAWPQDQEVKGRGSGILDAHAALLALDQEIDRSSRYGSLSLQM